MAEKFGWPSGTKCAVTLSFDDCFEETHNSVLPLLRAYNFKGTFNVITGFVEKGFESFIADWRQLKTAVMEGHEIASHTVTHKPLSNSLKTKIRRFLRSFPNAPNKVRFLRRVWHLYVSQKSENSALYSREHLSDLNEAILSKKVIEEKTGTKCTSFVYPGGSYDTDTKKLIRRVGYESARSFDIGFNNPNNPDFYALKVMAWDSWTTADEVNKLVDKAIKNGDWLIECFHLVSNEWRRDYPYFAPLEELQKHLKYLKSRESEILVETQHCVVKFIKVKKLTLRNRKLLAETDLKFKLSSSFTSK